ncbi:MAG: RagB/SusD family nutrient uptake outer membrane protein [Betaproteobacteria bacterium]
MSNRTLRGFAVAALLGLAAAACTDPAVAPKSTVTTANIFTDKASYQEFLARIYAGLIVTGQQGPAGNPDIGGIDEGFSEYLRLYWYLQEVPTDEAVIGWNDPGLPDLNRGTWGSDNNMVNAMYYRVYFQVMMANEFLRQTVDDSLDARGQSDMKNVVHQYRAEARFLRALSYAHGIDLFGNIPLVTDADPLGATPPQQATRDSIYKWVVSELNAVKDSLPAPGASTYGRATPDAANMLLAELYLNAGVYTGTADYADALAAAQAVATSGNYTLASNFRDNFTADNNLSPEMIFAAPQDGNHTQTWGGMTFVIHASCGGSMQASWFGMDYCWGGYRMKQQAYRWFGPGDSRGAMIYDSLAAYDSTKAARARDSIAGKDPSTWTNIDSTMSDSVSDIGNFERGAAYPKFTNKTSTGAGGQQLGMVDTDFPIFRLAEAYLIYAEANLRGGGGDATTALNYVNALRERAYGDNSHDLTAGQLTLDTLLAERGRELMFEAKRRTDLVRYGLFQPNTYVWAWKGNTAGGTALPAGRDLYPLPATELIANPNLTQNPGY